LDTKEGKGEKLTAGIPHASDIADISRSIYYWCITESKEEVDKSYYTKGLAI